jgi:hypothetical protein
MDIRKHAAKHGTVMRISMRYGSSLEDPWMGMNKQQI